MAPMDRFNALGRGMQIMLVAGVLLFIDMFFAWQDFADVVEFSGWEGFAGVVLGLLTIVLVVWIVLRLAAVDLPLPISEAMTTAILGGLILAFGIIKLLSILGDEPTIWAFIGLVLAVAIGFGAWLVVQGAGGMDTLRSEMPNRTAASTMETPPPMPTTPPAGAPEAAPRSPEPPPPTTEPAPEASPDAERAPDDMDDDRRT
jgi:hypothetical protein